MPRLLIAMAAALAVADTPAIAAAPCKDAKGKFIKCPPPAAAPAAKPTAAATKVVVKKTTVTTHKGPCRDAKGRFTKCK